MCATNHFLRVERPHWLWDWRAVTLNPYYEGNDQGAMIDDDALIRVWARLPPSLMPPLDAAHFGLSMSRLRRGRGSRFVPPCAWEAARPPSRRTGTSTGAALRTQG